MKEKPGTREKILDPQHCQGKKHVFFFKFVFFLFVFGPKIMCHPDPKRLSSQARAIVKTTTSPPP
jgi:hypothetical protein